MQQYMKRSASLKRYENFYAMLLRLYPKTYQQQFAEPMLQTFTDLCHERHQSKGNVSNYVLKLYADTCVGIIKERSKEVVMSSKANKSKLIAISGGVMLVVFTTVLIWNNRQSNVIAPHSSLKDARELSERTKSACLTDDQQAVEAVKKDDTYIEDGKYSKFSLTASEGLMDVPAGTMYEITINSYDGKTAEGTIEYEQDYGTYNYIIEKASGPDGWKFISMTPCQK
jgi:hypothetical protein